MVYTCHMCGVGVAIATTFVCIFVMEHAIGTHVLMCMHPLQLYVVTSVYVISVYHMYLLFISVYLFSNRYRPHNEHITP